MGRYRVSLVVLAVMLSGVALIPYVGLASEPFTWERYTNAYIPGTVEVSIQDFFFSPDMVVVYVGGTVRWTNEGAVAHTVTSEEGVFDSGLLDPGDVFEFTFDSVGPYPYICTIHPEMTGTVVVVQPRVFLPIMAR